uniref:uncharacterized protein LOC129502706 isoform X2 n=1 Tax=Nyctereutes procyonoides TaxID=34880 RepID=UPI00244410F3|nr:uncharacterized protein LOC129502706 isoform X2 [Nyctereutes procyonoides]
MCCSDTAGPDSTVPATDPGQIRRRVGSITGDPPHGKKSVHRPSMLRGVPSEMRGAPGRGRLGGGGAKVKMAELPQPSRFRPRPPSRARQPARGRSQASGRPEEAPSLGLRGERGLLLVLSGQQAWPGLIFSREPSRVVPLGQEEQPAFFFGFSHLLSVEPPAERVPTRRHLDGNAAQGPAPTPQRPRSGANAGQQTGAGRWAASGTARGLPRGLPSPQSAERGAVVLGHRHGEEAEGPPRVPPQVLPQVPPQVLPQVPPQVRLRYLRCHLRCLLRCCLRCLLRCASGTSGVTSGAASGAPQGRRLPLPPPR